MTGAMGEPHADRSRSSASVRTMNEAVRGNRDDQRRVEVDHERRVISRSEIIHFIPWRL
jgi:hypothetical protein